MSDKLNNLENGPKNIADVFAEDFLNSEMYFFNMTDGEKNVGEIHISIHRKKIDGSKEKHTYPPSFYVENSDQLKPILEIDAFGTVGNSGKGYGRAGLQRAYEMSVEKGCDGRMMVHAAWDAGSFYEHCGFMGEEQGQPGIKYFESNPENMEKLYKGGRRENLTLKEAKMMDLGDLTLDNVIEQKLNKNETQEYNHSETEKQPQKQNLSPMILHNLNNMKSK